MLRILLSFTFLILAFSSSASAEDDHPGYRFARNPERTQLRTWTRAALAKAGIAGCEIAVPEFKGTADFLADDAWGIYVHEQNGQPYLIYDGLQWINTVLTYRMRVSTTPDFKMITSVDLEMFRLEPVQGSSRSEFVLRAQKSCEAGLVP